MNHPSSFWFSFAVFASFALSACGRTVETTGGAVGGATSTSGTGSSAATNPATTTVANSSASTTAATSTGSGPCMGVVTATIDNGGPMTFASSCAGTWGASMTMTAAAWDFAGGPPPGTQGFVIDGCATAAMGSTGLQLAIKDAMSPGTYTTGMTQYTDASGKTWGVAGDAFKVTLTNIGPPGGAVDGMFSVTASQGGNAAHLVDGTFHVCRVNDELTP